MLTSQTERAEVYFQANSFIVNHGNPTLPADLDAICRRLGIAVSPLSKLTAESGLPPGHFTRRWHNPNGAANSGDDGPQIFYNDLGGGLRWVFTYAEELFHIILGHTTHPMYSRTEPAPWDERLYQWHDECARIAAGQLLCPPPVFYALPRLNTVNGIMRLCRVSRECAQTRFDVMRDHADEIVRSAGYTALCWFYHKYIQEKGGADVR